MAFFHKLTSHYTEAPSAVEVYGAVVGEDFDALFSGAANLRHLWFLFVGITTRTNPLDPGIMRKRDFVTLMRQCRVIAMRGAGRFHPLATPLLEADVNVIHQAETHRGSFVKDDRGGNKRGAKRRKLTYSCFLLAVVSIARRTYRQASDPLDAVRMLLAINILPHTAQVVKFFLSERARGFAPAMDEKLRIGDGSDTTSRTLPPSTAGFAYDDALVVLLARFSPCLKEIFSYFGSVPGSAELMQGRHALRSDLDQLSQALTYKRWLDFAAVFNISPGTAASNAAVFSGLTNVDLATVFYATIAMQQCDDVGGLTFEEFLEALVHCAVLLHAAATEGRRFNYSQRRTKNAPLRENKSQHPRSVISSSSSSSNGFMQEGPGAVDHSETYHFSDVANSYSTSLSTKEELSKSAEIDHTNKHLRVKQRRQWGTSSAVETESDKENDNGSAISVLMDRNDNASEEGSVWSLDSYSAGQQQDEELAPSDKKLSWASQADLQAEQQPTVGNGGRNTHPHFEHFEGLIPGRGGTGGSVAGEQRVSLASRQFEALLERMAAMVPDTVPRLVNHGHERVHWVEKNGYPCGGNRKVPSDGRRLIKGSKRLLELTQQLRRERMERAASEEAVEYERRAEQQALQTEKLQVERTPVLALAAEKLRRHFFSKASATSAASLLSKAPYSTPQPGPIAHSVSRPAVYKVQSSLNKLGPVSLGHPIWVGGFRPALSLPRQSPRPFKANSTVTPPAAAKEKSIPLLSGSSGPPVGQSTSRRRFSNTALTTTASLSASVQHGDRTKRSHVTNVPHLQLVCGSPSSPFRSTASALGPSRGRPIHALNRAMTTTTSTTTNTTTATMATTNNSSSNNNNNNKTAPVNAGGKYGTPHTTVPRSSRFRSSPGVLLGNFAAVSTSVSASPTDSAASSPRNRSTVRSASPRLRRPRSEISDRGGSLTPRSDTSSTESEPLNSNNPTCNFSRASLGRENAGRMGSAYVPQLRSSTMMTSPSQSSLRAETTTIANTSTSVGKRSLYDLRRAMNPNRRRHAARTQASGVAAMKAKPIIGTTSPQKRQMQPPIQQQQQQQYVDRSANALNKADGAEKPTKAQDLIKVLENLDLSVRK